MRRTSRSGRTWTAGRRAARRPVAPGSAEPRRSARTAGAPIPSLAAPPTGRIRRARRIGSTFGRVYLGIQAHRLLARRLPSPEMTRRWNRFHRSSADSIYTTAVELGGLILKGCQFLGSRADVLPPPYVEALSKLQDRVPPSPFRLVRRAVEHELGCEIGEVFESFSREPVAAASLAQVHEAHLHGGERVAVKVQYPEIARLVRGDLANLRALLRGVGWLEREFELEPLVEEFATYVRRELNFLSEARNAERVAGFFAGREDIGVPRVHWELTTRRVLVMEFVEGIKVTDAAALRAAGVDARGVVQTLTEAYCEQILRRGFFHADPHPGNLLVVPRPDGGHRLVFLDFGLSKELPADFRRSAVGFASAMLRSDADAMAEALLELGFVTRHGSPDGLSEIANFVLGAARELSAGRDAALAEQIQRLPEAIRNDPLVRVPTDLVLLARVLGLVTGVNRALGVRPDLATTVLRYATPDAPTPPFEASPPP